MVTLTPEQAEKLKRKALHDLEVIDAMLSGIIDDLGKGKLEDACNAAEEVAQLAGSASGAIETLFDAAEDAKNAS